MTRGRSRAEWKPTFGHQSKNFQNKLPNDVPIKYCLFSLLLGTSGSLVLNLFFDCDPSFLTLFLFQFQPFLVNAGSNDEPQAHASIKVHKSWNWIREKSNLCDGSNFLLFNNFSLYWSPQLRKRKAINEKNYLKKKEIERSKGFLASSWPFFYLVTKPGWSLSLAPLLSCEG